MLPVTPFEFLSLKHIKRFHIPNILSTINRHDNNEIDLSHLSCFFKLKIVSNEEEVTIYESDVSSGVVDPSFDLRDTQNTNFHKIIEHEAVSFFIFELYLQTVHSTDFLAQRVLIHCKRAFFMGDSFLDADITVRQALQKKRNHTNNNSDTNIFFLLAETSEGVFLLRHAEETDEKKSGEEDKTELESNNHHHLAWSRSPAGVATVVETPSEQKKQNTENRNNTDVTLSQLKLWTEAARWWEGVHRLLSAKKTETARKIDEQLKLNAKKNSNNNNMEDVKNLLLQEKKEALRRENERLGEIQRKIIKAEALLASLEGVLQYENENHPKDLREEEELAEISTQVLNYDHKRSSLLKEYDYYTNSNNNRFQFFLSNTLF
ncbi:hypothetical protein AGDE_14616 [Angomonas deanei]|uniref:Uncharacterized protein n=1 Tax=Angomonas deanei TaxID=59799 RepID=A0A7G2CRJ8_9TRYP|nr:hypothetical protein AGDE_14616 [Angomonas deanei]CAD2222426.1 hypothetical protein, conserved [Angomonas deanei]|eukprot:EPY20536.1 hypothetical protein AGDE_14616 [Angomonas deanei]